MSLPPNPPPESDKAPHAPDSLDLGARERLGNLLNPYRHAAWSVAIISGLVLFLAVLPTYIQNALVVSLLTQWPLTLMLFGFSLLALSLLWSKGQHMDAWAFLFFNVRGTRPRWLDWLMLGGTQIGNSGLALVLGIGLIFTPARRFAYEFILGTSTVWLFVEVVKSIAKRSRPYVRLTQARIVGYREGGLSFPSGHTSQAFFLVTLLVGYYALGFWVALLLYAVAVWVGITRLYVGAHYPRDVLAGAILGTVWGLLWGVIDASFRIGPG